MTLLTGNMARVRSVTAASIYDIEANSFTWGSWILNANEPPKAALESAVLIYEIAFDLLELESVRFDVRRDN